MYGNKELCEKIRAIYPEVGDCGIDIQTVWDEKESAWIVDLKKGHHELTTHLEEKDADRCMEGKQCVALGIQIAQLKANLGLMPD